ALLDVQMPGMSGYELAELLRGDPKTRNIPLLFLTAFDADERQLFKGYRAGGVDFLTKPYSPEILLGKVRIFLEIFRARRDAERNAAELLKARDEALAANRAKSLFLANMSHELRTPLNAILGFAQILSRASDLPSPHREKVSIILGAGEHLLAIINNILDLAKIESGKIETDSVDMDLGKLLDDVVRLLRERAASKDLELLLEQASSVPRRIMGDASKLRQILVNLVGNAIKFTSIGGVTLRITSPESDEANKRLVFEIQDSGCGMHREDLDRIFEPFVQLQQREGTGLGLAITRQYIHLLGGSLQVQSEFGKGSIFRIILPYLPAESSGEPEDILDQGRIAGLEGAAAKRILIVEDLRDNRLLVRSLLEPFGFQLKEAENGKEGVDAVREWHPHLVLMDRRMPVMDGLETARSIRALPIDPQPTIVAMTAHAFRDERLEMMDAGCDDFIAKPFHDDELFLVLARHLGLVVLREPVSTLSLGAAADAMGMDALGCLPVLLRHELRDAFLGADMDRIGTLVSRVGIIDRSLAGCLAEHADNFRYELVIKAIDRSMEEPS
ncbi:MAG: response regulator, partial [Fibrobacterota bacterium]